MRHLVRIKSVKQVFLAVVGIATIVLLLAIAGCGGSGSAASTPQDSIASICESTTGGEYDCSCVADAVVSSGYDTDLEISELETAANAANQSGDLTTLPQPVLNALGSCPKAPQS
jgi:hypothetical protein